MVAAMVVAVTAVANAKAHARQALARLVKATMRSRASMTARVARAAAMAVAATVATTVHAHRSMVASRRCNATTCTWEPVSTMATATSRALPPVVSLTPCVPAWT